MARLTVEINGERHSYGLTEQGLQIGRALDNSIILNHAIVSRRHAALELRGGDAWVRDLGSRNGVFVNRLRVKEAQLAHGDIVRVGPFELRYEDRAAQSIVLDDNRYYPLAAEARAMPAPGQPVPTLDLQEFYQLGKRLNGLIHQNDLLDAVIEEVLRLVPAQRAVLMLRRDGELVPMRVVPPSREDVALSSTIVRRALDAGEAILTRDARLDFAGSDSIISANIRSAICVPLLVESLATGVLYVDSPGQNQFDDRQRDLLAALASQAATHIERARLTEELRERLRLQENLERFMSPNVARLVAHYLSEHGQLPEPEELSVTVLFADVHNFTSLSEGMSPREMQDLLNEYFHEMTEVIFSHDGTLDKYIGDGIMALFGAPRLSPDLGAVDYAVRAVDAALGMIEAHRRLVDKLDPARTFNFRIGINTGPVFAGFFGTKRRLEYTVIGDTVNTASRLEGKADLNSVLISEATRQVIGETFRLQEMGEFQLKGKSQRVRTYKVLGRA